MNVKEIASLNVNKSPLVLEDVPTPPPGKYEILVNVSCCGICHAELEEIEGRTPPPSFPIHPGHQVVGMFAGSSNRDPKFCIGE